MADQQLSAVLRRLRGAAGTPHTGRTDRELIADFAASNDQAAFVALVKRHGPLVMGICRRVLHHLQDAEDAFQATFLLLARRGAGIRKPESLASWLHGVAHRMARNAKRSAARRRRHEGTAQPAPSVDRAAGLEWREVQAILDDEISRLPEVYRTPFILFYLEHRRQADIARQLGIKEGTVWSRLAHARRLLQERLSRRGVALPAVLGLLAVSAEATSAAVPASLVSSVVRAATLAAAGSAGADVASAGVMTLLQGADRAMTFGTCKTATLFLLTAGVLGAVFAFAWGRPPAARAIEPARAEAPPAQPPSRPAAPAPGVPDKKEGDPKETVEVSGRVLGPDGKPFAGARLVLWTGAVKKHEDLSTKATTGADGRFRFAVARADLRRDAKVVATAEGYGPDWVALGPRKPDGEVTLRLVKDDVPVTGRVLNLEGRPVAGATVYVGRVEQVDLTEWLAVRKREVLPGTGSIDGDALDGPAAVKTDKDGRFRLTGLGRDRVAHLSIRDPGIESLDVQVIARPGPCDGMRLSPRLDFPVHAPGADLTVRPGQPIVGTVRDRKTGKPVAGIKVVSANWNGLPFLSSTQRSWPEATTDEKGQYRIEGTAKQKKYAVAAGGRPYFNSTRLDVLDTPGLDPLRVDFELDRGVVVRGRLLDGATGQPVRGRAGYKPRPDNPHLKDFPDLVKAQIIAPATGGTADDGPFAVLCAPGPGWLTAVADDGDAYTAAHEPGGFQLHNAVLRIEPSETDPKSLVQDVVLQPARTLAGSVAGPDGRPLTGAYVAGLDALWKFGRGPQKLESASIRVHGLPPGGARVVVFFHPEKQLARVQTIRADDKEPLTVRLEATGALTGRALDAGGRPQAGLKVKASYRWQDLNQARIEGTDFKDLPGDLLYDYPDWEPIINRETTTDKGGKFRIDGLIPGLRYDLTLMDGTGPDAIRREKLSAESGKDKELGDLK
jgi:RNA polymerase sigma factor (sigma-70 family)